MWKPKNVTMTPILSLILISSLYILSFLTNHHVPIVNCSPSPSNQHSNPKHHTLIAQLSPNSFIPAGTQQQNGEEQQDDERYAAFLRETLSGNENEDAHKETIEFLQNRRARNSARGSYHLGPYKLKIPHDWNQTLSGAIEARGEFQQVQKFNRATRTFDQETYFELKHCDGSFGEICVLKTNGASPQQLEIKCKQFKVSSEASWNVCVHFHGGRKSDEQRGSSEKQHPLCFDFASGEELTFRITPPEGWFKDFQSGIVLRGGDETHEIYLSFSSLDVLE